MREQRREAAGVHQLRIRVAGNQPFDGVDVAALDRRRQQRFAVVINGVQVCASAEEQFDHGPPAGIAGGDGHMDRLLASPRGVRRQRPVIQEPTGLGQVPTDPPGVAPACRRRSCADHFADP